MTRTSKITYWIATAWLSLGMISTGFVQLTRMEDEVDRMNQLGYSDYLLPILGAWKFLGVIAILVPRFPLVKEWAYAGFFFLMSGALLSHLAKGDPANEFFGPGLLLILTGVSWYFRPASRKLTTNNVAVA